MTHHAVLTVEEHRELRISAARDAASGDAVMSCVVVPDEFRRVQNDYPILFRLNLERDSFTALALFGFEAGENLFLADRRWDARYRPLAMEIQPFLIGRPADGAGEKQVHVDLASPRVATAGEGTRVFDEDGRPTPYLEAIAERLGALDIGLDATPAFFAALRCHDLLEPLTLEVALDDGSTHRLVGFHVVDEERLQSLDADALGELHDAGWLLPIFMAVASLANIAALVARRNARAAHG